MASFHNRCLDCRISFVLHHRNDRIPSPDYSVIVTRQLASTTSLSLGNFSWSHRRYTCSDSICSAIDAYIPVETRRRSQHTHDDDPDPWWLPHGDQHRVETWNKLDKLGNFSSRGAPSGLSSHHVHRVESPSTQTRDRRFWKPTSSGIPSFIVVRAVSR